MKHKHIQQNKCAVFLIKAVALSRRLLHLLARKKNADEQGSEHRKKVNYLAQGAKICRLQTLQRETRVLKSPALSVCGSGGLNISWRSIVASQ